MTLKFYLDETMKKEISDVSWKGSISITLVDGQKIDNVFMIGDMAIADFFVVNDSENNFGITALIVPDSRIIASIESPWLYTNKPVKITLKFPVNSELIITGNKLEIKGYYVITS